MATIGLPLKINYDVKSLGKFKSKAEAVEKEGKKGFASGPAGPLAKPLTNRGENPGLDTHRGLILFVSSPRCCKLKQCL